jgi:hypothetical protein
VDEQEALLSQVVRVLEEMGVPYMIGGSVALSVWAVPRTTHDIDVVVDLPGERIPEFCSAFPSDRYFIDSEVMEDAFRQLNRPSLGMYSFVDMETGIKVDLFPLRPNDEAQRVALSRREKASFLPDMSGAVYAPDDLLVQKLRWYAASGSERQFRDCLNLVTTDLKRPAPLIDWGYVEDWAERLGPDVQQAWMKVKAAVNGACRDDLSGSPCG